MYLRTVPLTRANLASTRALWPRTAARGPEALDRIADLLSALLHARRERGAIVLENNAAHAFAAKAPLDARRSCATWCDAIPMRLDTNRACASFLDRVAIGRANADGGLHLVVRFSSCGHACADPPAVLGRLIEAFFEALRGYRVATVANEAIGWPALERLFRAPGDADGHRRTAHATTAATRGMVIVTREDAARVRPALLPLFAYSPPRLRLTAAQQDLLEAALAAPSTRSSRRVSVSR